MTTPISCAESVAARDAAFWQHVALQASGVIDALLLYATAYPNDSHALNGYAFLERLNAELGIKGLPRTAQTFSRAANGRYVMPPFPERPITPEQPA